MGKKKKSADFQKVKFKVGKKLPKSANFTDTSFKSRSIVIREQLKLATGAPLSKSKHTLQELLSQTRHYNGTVRQSAASSLQELVGAHPDLLRQNASAALDAALALCADRESAVRAAAQRLVGAVLAGFEEASARPFFAAVGAHVCRALTHLSDSVRLDALQLFDSVAAAYPSFVATRAAQLLAIFVDQISKARGGAGGSSQRRTLSIDPNSLLSEQRNRSRVLKRIRLVLQTLVDGCCDGRSSAAAGENEQDARQLVESRLYYFCSAVSGDGVLPTSGSQNSVVAMDAHAFAASLCPLLNEHWIETMPAATAHHTAAGHLVKAMDVAALESVPSIATLIWKLLKDFVMTAKDAQADGSFVVDQGKALAQTLLAGFPYTSHGHQAGQRTKRKNRADGLSVALEDQGAVKRPGRSRQQGVDKAAAASSEQLPQPRLVPPAFVLQQSLREQLVRGCHHGLRGGEHRDGRVALSELRTKYYWPGMDGEAAELMRTCQCTRAALPPSELASGQPPGAWQAGSTISGDGLISTGALLSGFGADGSSSRLQTTAALSKSGIVGKLAPSGEPASVDNLNVAISSYVGTLASCGRLCEPEWAKRVLSFVAVSLADSHSSPAPRTVKQLLDAAYALFQQTETEGADDTKTFIQVFSDLFSRSIGNSSTECIATMLQFIRSVALSAVVQPSAKTQQLAAALALPLVDLLKGARSWPLLQACGQPAAAILRDLAVRGLCSIGEEDLAACLRHLLAVSACATSGSSQDDVAIYLRKLVDLIACSRAELTRASLVPLSKLLRLLNHCGATLSYCLHSLQDRYQNKGLVNGIDFFSFVFTFLLDGPASAERCLPTTNGCAAGDAELSSDAWRRAQVVRGVLLQFSDTEQVVSVLNAFVGRVLSRRQQAGLSSPTCAALLLCSEGLDGTRSMPADVLLALVAPPVLRQPESSPLSELLVRVLSSRTDVLGKIVAGLRFVAEHTSTDDATKTEGVCGALTWLLRAMPACVLAAAGVLTAVDEHLNAVGKAPSTGSTAHAGSGSAAASATQSLWYELRRAKMESISRPTAAEL